MLDDVPLSKFSANHVVLSLANLSQLAWAIWPPAPGDIYPGVLPNRRSGPMSAYFDDHEELV